MAAGYVYILINAAMPGLLKIGRTDKTSEERAAELSATTGLPARFQVAFDAFVSDSSLVERIIHERLAKSRISGEREFFCEPLKVAIRVLEEVARDYPAYNSGVPGFVYVLLNTRHPTEYLVEASTKSANLRLREVEHLGLHVVLFELRVPDWISAQSSIKHQLKTYQIEGRTSHHRLDFAMAKEVLLRIVQIQSVPLKLTEGANGGDFDGVEKSESSGSKPLTITFAA